MSGRRAPSGRHIGFGWGKRRGESQGFFIIMATEILLPKIGFAMTEGDLAEWLAEDGQTVSEGQALFLLEAEKSANEIEAPATGTLRILKPAGATYEVGTVLGTIE
jgi:pyruvate/2-oxoglutarate dehydrogenase complex dihydrolipoamide acyltransferase (E2) component